MEHSLTDLFAGRIIDNEILPKFKEGKFEEGIVAGVGGIVAAVRGEYKEKPGNVGTSMGAMVLFIIIVAVLIISRAFGIRGDGRFKKILLSEFFLTGIKYLFVAATNWQISVYF